MAIVVADALAGSALLLSIASPVITSMINSHTQKREREAAFYKQKRAEIFENYLQSASAFISNPSDKAYAEYGKARGLILLFADADALDLILDLDSHLIEYRFATPGQSSLLFAKLRKISDLLICSYPRLKDKRRKRHMG